MESLQSRAEAITDGSVNDLLSMLGSRDWEDLGEKDGVHGYQMNVNGRNNIKSIGVINRSAAEVCQFILDNSQKKSWDEMLIESKLLHDFGAVKIMQESFSAPWPVSSRDFVFANKWTDRGEDILIVAKSIDIGVPEQRGVVRGELIISGFLLKKLAENRTELTYCMCVDPKGMIPTMIVNQSSKKQISNVGKIRKVIERR